MAAAHQRKRNLPEVRRPTRRDPDDPDRRRYPVDHIPLNEQNAARHVPAADDLAHVGTELLVVAAIFEGQLRRELKSTTVDDLDAARALLVIGAAGAHPEAIARLLAVSPATASRIADRLEAAGLVDRQFFTLDRRTIRLRATRAGLRARIEVLAAVRRATVRVLGDDARQLCSAFGAARGATSRKGDCYGVRLGREYARRDFDPHAPARPSKRRKRRLIA
jgi:DNA-binding MarR family transcriptional regulator